MLTQHNPTGFAVLADSAFPRTSACLKGKIVRVRKQNEVGRGDDAPENFYIEALEKLKDRAVPSERQSAEWGFVLSKVLSRG